MPYLPLLKEKLDSCASRFKEPIDAQLYQIFVSCLALKLLFEPLLVLGPAVIGVPLIADVSHPILAIRILACGLVIFSKPHQRIGLAIYLVLSVTGLLRTLPYTSNHAFLETFLLISLLLWPPHPVPKEAEQSPATVDGTACRLIMFAILTVFFWSGVQKIYHGYYLNGEFFTLLLFVPEESAIRALVLASLDGLVATTKLVPLPEIPEPNWLRAGAISYPSWAIHLLIVQSHLIVLSEVLFPLLVVFERTRQLGKLLLIPTAIGIAVISWETGFALTNVACVLLFFPRQARWSFASAFALVLAIHYARLVSINAV